MICAYCKTEIKEEYYSIMDNHIQYSYFDELDGSDNIFCSKDCLCDSLMVESFNVGDQL